MNELLKNPLYREDVDRVMTSATIPWQRLRGKSVLITGATGLICSAVIDLLLYYNETKDANIKIYAVGRSLERVAARFGKETVRFLPYDANEAIAFDAGTDYIIHGAGNASPELYVSQAVETMLSNILGLKNLLEYAKAHRVQRVLYISSSEVYGKRASERAFEENDYGYVDVLNVRSSYPMAKRAAETLCQAYREEYGIDSVIVRPGHIYGPTASERDKKISSMFAYQAARGETLVMKSAGMQKRSYCHCLDCAVAILTVLLQGQNGQAYNISNPDSIITIYEMAQIMARSAGVELKREIPSEQEQRTFNPMENSDLNSEKLEKLGWKGVLTAEEGLKNTVKILASYGNSSR